LANKYKGSCKTHETLCDVVEERLQDMGLRTSKHVEYKLGRRDGEVDVMGFNDRYLIVCEIKSSDAKLERGVQQLYKAADRYESPERRLFMMLVYYDNNHKEKYEWIT
jgi:5-methylcytosine-specific restriction endonuclease McrBC regulatory subunit McrC